MKIMCCVVLYNLCVKPAGVKISISQGLDCGHGYSLLVKTFWLVKTVFELGCPRNM